MDNILRSTTLTAAALVNQYIQPGCTVVDATCGNGNDTLMLAKSTAKHVYAFDIQPAAIQSTKALLSEHNIPKEKVTLICDNHANMTAYLSAAHVIMFNLGYLPGSDKSLTTKKYNTIKRRKLSIVHIGKRRSLLHSDV